MYEEEKKTLEEKNPELSKKMKRMMKKGVMSQIRRRQTTVMLMTCQKFIHEQMLQKWKCMEQMILLWKLVSKLRDHNTIQQG